MPHAVVLNSAGKASLTGGSFADTLSALSGDSLAIPNFVNGGARIFKMWGIDSDSVMELALTASRFESVHDPQYGVRFNLPSLIPGGAALVGANTLLLPPAKIPVYSGDSLVMTVTGTASDDALVSWLTEYDDLPGTAGQFTDWSTVNALWETVIGLRCAPVAGTAAVYGTERALNADDTRLTGGKYYAILGWTVQTVCTTIYIRSTTFGNNKLGLPSGALDLRSDMGFVELSQLLGRPLIPVIAGYDAGNVFLAAADGEASTSPKVDLLMVQLRSNPLGG